MSEEVAANEVIEPAATPENVATPAPETQAAPEVKTEVETRTFTQAELDSIVAKEKAKAAAIADRRAMKAYRETLERVLPQPKEEPAKDGRPTRSAYADDDDYVEAMADWKIAQRDKEQAARRQQEQQRKTVEKTEAIYAEAQKIPGFDRDVFDDLPISPAMAAAITESDVSAKLMAYMASHPDEVERLANLSPARQAAEVGKMEAKVAAAPVKPIREVPAPIAPIGASRGGTKSLDDPNLSDAEFAALRRKQIAQRN